MPAKKKELVENVTQAIMSPSSEPRWEFRGLYGGKLSDHQAQSLNAEQMAVYRTALLHGRASGVVAEWKRANVVPYLSPEKCHDLADRIVAAMLWAQGEQE